ncbi:MAG: GNAT family N-acetyltransferase [Paracoccaceae bacterium]
MIPLVPTLETERLILRAPNEGDFEADVAFYASERSHGFGGPLSREQTWRNLATVLGHWIIRGYGFWAVDEKSTGLYCGHVGLWSPEGWPEPEIGWAVQAQAEGRGIAFEAALKARDYAYDKLGWSTAISSIVPGNTRSIALVRRMGATFENHYEHPSYGQMEIWRHPTSDALKETA